MPASLKSHSHGQTMVLTISNPEHRNALGPDLYAAGVEALNVAENSPEVRSVVITGEGAHFCAGGNLQRLMANRQQPPEVQAQSIEGLHNWIETIRTFPKPVVAAVEGSCAGAGFSLALACDMVVAAQNAVFVMAYSNVALSPDGGATWSLVHAMPRATALQLLMCGERISSERLFQLGVINQITGAGESLGGALALCERLNARAPNALASIKELANDAALAPLHQQLGSERDHFVRNLHHANAGEGIAAFLDKRPAQYR
jgi:enoyl-CoA hydratase/carnithine racemase